MSSSFGFTPQSADQSYQNLVASKHVVAEKIQSSKEIEADTLFVSGLTTLQDVAVIGTVDTDVLNVSGYVDLPVGSFTDPTLRFIGDPQTGLYQNGAGIVCVASEGVDAACFSAAQVEATGNFVNSTSGKGIVLGTKASTGTNSVTVTGGSRSGSLTCTLGATVNAGATTTIAVTNSAITGSGTIVLYTILSAAGTNLATSIMYIESVTNSASAPQSSVVIRNGGAGNLVSGIITLGYIVLD
jgi:hypothetical protein